MCCIWIPLLIGIVSALLGGVIGWLLRNRRVTELESELNELNVKHDELNSAHGELQEKYNEEHRKYLNLSTDFNVKREEVSKLNEEIEDLKTQLSEGVKTIEVIKEVPVEVIKEVEVIKQVEIKTEDDSAENSDSADGSSSGISSSFGAISGAGVGQSDDLTRIEGIGPKINELLNNAGINTFAELAAAEIKQIEKILEDAGPRFRIHDPGTWPQQSALARDGKWDELQELQDRLDGGI